MEAKAFEITGYNLYVFKNNQPYDTLHYDRLEDLVRRYEIVLSDGYQAYAEKVEHVIIE